MCTGTPFCDFSREFRVLVSAATESERTLAAGRRGVGGGPDGGERAVSHVDAYLVPWFDGYGPEAIYFVG